MMEPPPPTCCVCHSRAAVLFGFYCSPCYWANTPSQLAKAKSFAIGQARAEMERQKYLAERSGRSASL
jgi:hypothetical protein